MGQQLVHCGFLRTTRNVQRLQNGGVKTEVGIKIESVFHRRNNLVVTNGETPHVGNQFFLLALLQSVQTSDQVRERVKRKVNVYHEIEHFVGFTCRSHQSQDHAVVASILERSTR